MLKEILGIDELSKDVLTSLELYDKKNGYNNAAELLADSNGFLGIDAVRFGDSISIIKDRETHVNESILIQYKEMIDMYRKYYQYEEIVGSTRNKKEIIPEAAFREAIANALVHRTWDVKTNITVSMFENRVEITSPGGLPKGVTKEEYLRGGISVLRNPIIGNVFLRLNLIERFGTGIRRIEEVYKDSLIKPQYLITDNMIKVVLPVMDESMEGLSVVETAILNILKEYGSMKMSSSEVARLANLGKTRVVEILNSLSSAGYVEKIGVGRGTGYRAL